MVGSTTSARLGVVGAQSDADGAVGFHHVGGRHADDFGGSVSLIGTLINHGRILRDLPVAQFENHLPLRAQTDGVGTLEAHADPRRIGAGSQLEIVLQVWPFP